MYAIAEELGVAYRTIVNTKTNAIKKLRSYF
jgi:DNA-binding CsgD family transcriptional regulator